MNATEPAGPRSSLAALAQNISYEVMPFKSTEQAVVDHVPTEIPLTVTVTRAKGIDATLEVTERLLDHGYSAAPHLPARQFTDRHHVADVVARLREAGVRSVVVIGGDAPDPAGPFEDAHSLLQAMEAENHPFTGVGIGGYPEGRANIPPEALCLALKRKAPLATHIVTQICFDAGAIARWAEGIAVSGIDLPVLVGVPGPVDRQKLVRVSAGLGLGQSARFLRKQRHLLWRFLLPGGYHPAGLVRRLGAEVPRTRGGIRGLHIFTFNEVRKTEAWRRELLAALSEKDRP